MSSGEKGRRPWVQGAAASVVAVLALAACGPGPAPTPSLTTAAGKYPWHTGIVSTTFWVGEVFDAKASDGSQVYSTYDGQWESSYGGCDGVLSPACETEKRTAANGFMPSSMTPKENPFYLDLPFDDINDPKAFAQRATVVPWANEAAYARQATERSVSYMKNRWVRIRLGSAVCYGQIEDAGPGQYHDAAYVFGSDDARPANKNFNGAGMDVSPALNGCLGFKELNGQDDKVDWQFVDRADVPDGPWLKIVTTSPVRQ
ncbi:hypothetical protein ACQCSX_18665 [Pseudarthrobacter sp. P1]|uniref:hypothetical protein n=1 Tax=Pseudarthrobacter sp. P1 TaxID=3418418 RepID=UPI003CF53A4E